MEPHKAIRPFVVLLSLFVLLLPPTRTSRVEFGPVDHSDPFSLLQRYAMKWKPATPTFNSIDITQFLRRRLPDRTIPTPRQGILHPENPRAFIQMESSKSKAGCQFQCNVDNITLETSAKPPAGDAFGGNSALLFAYAQRLADIMAPGIELAKDRKAIYLTPPFTPGIAVEEPNPENLMNYQVWQYADNLLQADCPMWDHDGGSYFDFYSDYLSYASVAGSSSNDPKARNNMLHLAGQLKAAGKAVENAKEDAITKYKQIIADSASGAKLPPNFENLTVWLQQYTPYIVSQNDFKDKTELYNEARVDYYGEGVLEVSDLLTNIASAKEYTKSEPGFNMPCTSSSKSLAQRVQEAQSGKDYEGDTSADLFYKPKYNINGYEDAVGLWSENYHKNKKPETLFALSLDDLADTAVDWGSLGFPNIDSKKDEGVSPKDTVLSVATADRTLTPKVDDIIISVTDLQAFDISRGNWENPDFKSCFPKLRADAPLRLSSQIVRPCALLFGYGLKIQLKINSEDIDELTYSLENSETDKATLKLLGVDNNSLRTEGGTLVGTDEPDVGYPYLLAVLGDVI
ncbi:hypothetical protein H072_6055 [Dactylellina haptotyla CBS 200.50]|uniref:Uncharacterized protein n=1 Tax=Dactylellina haptotyla (strain CBS 200.50) TaxID=1284197 RepID=S8BL34_DACHA|nr:hypothetical protein H072_6055 [Dactylellina haptotyla CBS 200.50]